MGSAVLPTSIGTFHCVEMKVVGLLVNWSILPSGRSPCRNTCEIRLLSYSGNLAMHQL
jgi:hypothetical protein